MTKSDYDEGVRDARLDAIEKIQNDTHIRVGKVEKLSYMLVGAFLLIETVPALKALL